MKIDVGSSSYELTFEFVPGVGAVSGDHYLIKLDGFICAKTSGTYHGDTLVRFLKGLEDANESSEG